jgi:hypothetical protein
MGRFTERKRMRRGKSTKLPDLGFGTSNNVQGGPDRSWRWRESNPRSRATPWVFYGRSLRLGFARRLPQAEDRRASPASMSLEGRGALPAR